MATPRLSAMRSALSDLHLSTREKASFVFRALRIISLSARRWTILWLILIMIQGALPAATLYLTKWVVDSVSAAVGTGFSDQTLKLVFIPALLMAAVMLVQHVLGAFSSWINTAQSELVSDYVINLVHEKASKIDYAFYEHSEYYDRLRKVTSQASSRTLSVLQTLGLLLQTLVTLVSIGLILVQYGWILPIVLVISTGPALFVLIYFNRFYHSWWEANTEEMRRTGYFSGILTGRGFAAELRMYGLAGYFRDRFNRLRRRLRGERLQIEKNKLIAGVLTGLFGLFALGGIMAWMVTRALRGLATLGDLALFYQAFNKGEGVVKNLLGTMAQIHADTLFLAHLFEFLDEDMQRKTGDEAMPVPVRTGIRFEKVSFTYPNASRPALKDFDLFIPARKTIAIVGSNGAGKSTLTKLLCRLFEPEAGRVTIDGVDVGTIDPEDLRRHIAIMFQFPVPYQMTATENIAIGQVDVDMRAVERAADAAGADTFLERMEQRYDSMLGRSFSGGMDLSGGEWQRIALARAYYKPAEVYVLDEPTSFMDSWAEQDWLTRFHALSDGRTVVLITHRFTTAMQADYIYVMEGGAVVEAGTHDQLMTLDGQYAQSWRSQMQKGVKAAPGSAPLHGDGGGAPFEPIVAGAR